MEGRGEEGILHMQNIQSLEGETQQMVVVFWVSQVQRHFTLTRFLRCHLSLNSNGSLGIIYIKSMLFSSFYFLLFKPLFFLCISGFFPLRFFLYCFLSFFSFFFFFFCCSQCFLSFPFSLLFFLPFCSFFSIFGFQYKNYSVLVFVLLFVFLWWFLRQRTMVIAVHRYKDMYYKKKKRKIKKQRF